MSSTIASVSRNSLSPVGTRGPSSARTPTANAMSVAIGMPQPSLAGDAEVEREEDQRRERPSRRALRSPGARPSGVAEVALDELALDLEPDHEEEDGHQPVVDPVAQVVGDRQVADAEREVGVPRSRRSRCPRRWPRRARRRSRPSRTSPPSASTETNSSPTGEVAGGERDPDVGAAGQVVALRRSRPERRPDFPAHLAGEASDGVRRRSRCRRAWARRSPRTRASACAASWRACA